MSARKLLLLFVLTGLLSACQQSADGWVGFYYPAGAPSYGEAICEIQEFSSEEDCESWAIKKGEDNEDADFYCGYRCIYDSTCQYAC